MRVWSDENYLPKIGIMLSVAIAISYSITLIIASLCPPVYLEVPSARLQRFIEIDHTENSTYVIGLHDCRWYAHTLQDNAKAWNISMELVTINWQYDNGTGHMIDRSKTEFGWEYIEPQTDGIMNYQGFLSYYDNLDGMGFVTSMRHWNGAAWVEVDIGDR